MVKKIVIKIKDAKVVADYQGFSGNACELLANKINPEGLEEESKELKPEYHRNAHANSTVFE